MPKFDLSTAGPEMQSIYALADMISEMEPWQSICEQDTTEEARKKILIGYSNAPDDYNEYSESELARINSYCHLIHRLEGGRMSLPGDMGIDSMEAGEFIMHIRKYARPQDDRADLLDWFTDQYSKIEGLITEMSAPWGARECPRIQQVLREVGPAYREWDSESAQGGAVFGVSVVTWGGPLGGES